MATDYFNPSTLTVNDGDLAEADNINDLVNATDTAFELVLADIIDIEDVINKYYLGAYSSAPTTDNNGGVLLDGALYYDTSDSQLYVYDSGWIDAYNPMSAYETRLSTAESDIDTLQSNVSTLQSSLSTAESDIDTLQSGLSTAQSNISTISSSYIKKDGTVAMTGELILSSSTPSSSLKAASKGYVDTQITSNSISNATTTTAGKVELATADETKTGYDTTRAITPNGFLCVFSRYLYSNGFYHLPGDFVVQWGITGTISTNNGVNVTFPEAFTNVFNVQATAIYESSDSHPDSSLHISNVSTTGFRLSNTDASYSITAYWFAIGKIVS